MATELERALPQTRTPARRRSLTERWAHSEHARGLLLIGVFKLSKTVLSVALGVGALHLMNHDLAGLALRALDAMRIDPESRLVSLVVAKADLIGNQQLRHFSIVTFCYAGLCLIEGTGLLLEKRWAEYFTITLTILALPLEGYEIAKHATMLKVAVLLINVLVVIYLAWLLRRKTRTEEQGTRDQGEAN